MLVEVGATLRDQQNFDQFFMFSDRQNDLKSDRQLSSLVISLLLFIIILNNHYLSLLYYHSFVVIYFYAIKINNFQQAVLSLSFLYFSSFFSLLFVCNFCDKYFRVK